MKKILPLLIVLAALVIGWFIVSSGSTVDYVATVDEEVAALETELATLDQAVAAGTLTPEQATEAKVKILTRLNTINNSVATSESAKLTPEQRQQLTEGLNRLKTILINYQNTLSIVDDTAIESEVQKQLATEDDASDKLSLTIADTISTVEDVAEEVIEDYIPNEVLDEQVDAVVEEESIPTEEIEILDETGTSTDEMIDTETTTSDEATVSEESAEPVTPSTEDTTTVEEEQTSVTE